MARTVMNGHRIPPAASEAPDNNDGQESLVADLWEESTGAAPGLIAKIAGGRAARAIEEGGHTPFDDEGNCTLPLEPSLDDYAYLDDAIRRTPLPEELADFAWTYENILAQAAINLAVELSHTMSKVAQRSR